MAKEFPFKRDPLYFHRLPDADIERMIGKERWHFLTADIFKTIFEEPSLSMLRMFLGGMIMELYNEPQEARDAGYSELDIMISLTVLQELATTFGIILGEEIKAIHSGGVLMPIDPSTKYISYKDLVAQADQLKLEGEVMGMVHGAIDPPHLGHSRAATRIWPYCRKVAIGFDPNWALKQRKGKEPQGSDRPRFDLAWRMWEMASLPTVDWVFVLPLKEGGDEQYFEMYKTLGIGVLGTSEDNMYLEQYRARMAMLGGHVVTDGPVRWSSTLLMEALAKKSSENYDRIQQDKKWATERGRVARSLGYLRDYADGTNNPPSK